MQENAFANENKKGYTKIPIIKSTKDNINNSPEIIQTAEYFS